MRMCVINIDREDGGRNETSAFNSRIDGNNQNNDYYFVMQLPSRKCGVFFAVWVMIIIICRMYL